MAETGPVRHAPSVRGEEIGFQHRLGHFFDKQRDAIAFLHEVLHDLSREEFASGDTVCDALHHLGHLGTREPIERHLRQVGTTTPRRLKLGPTGRQQTERGRGHLVYYKAEPLDGGRIDPVEVFHNQRVGCSAACSNRIARRVSRVFCLCRCGEREREDNGPQAVARTGERPRTASSLPEGADTGGASAPVSSTSPLGYPLAAIAGLVARVNDGIQSSVLIIRRTATLPPRMCFPCYMFFEHLHEARLANPSLTTQDDHVPHAVLDLSPASCSSATSEARPTSGVSQPVAATSSRVCAALACRTR